MSVLLYDTTQNRRSPPLSVYNKWNNYTIIHIYFIDTCPPNMKTGAHFINPQPTGREELRYILPSLRLMKFSNKIWSHCVIVITDPDIIDSVLIDVCEAITRHDDINLIQYMVYKQGELPEQAIVILLNHVIKWVHPFYISVSIRLRYIEMWQHEHIKLASLYNEISWCMLLPVWYKVVTQVTISVAFVL